MNFFSLDFTFNIRNLIFILLRYTLDFFFPLLCNSYYDIIFSGLKNIFDFWEIGIDNLINSGDLLKLLWNFLLQFFTQYIRDFILHWCYDALNFFLVGGVLRY